jgi:hypothetical protein
MKIISKIIDTDRCGQPSNVTIRPCKYFFEHQGRLDITYYNMRKKGVKIAHDLNVLSITACTAQNDSMCPKKHGDMKGKVTPQCRNRSS